MLLLVHSDALGSHALDSDASHAVVHLDGWVSVQETPTVYVKASHGTTLTTNHPGYMGTVLTHNFQVVPQTPPSTRDSPGFQLSVPAKFCRKHKFPGCSLKASINIEGRKKAGGIEANR